MNCLLCVSCYILLTYLYIQYIVVLFSSPVNFCLFGNLFVNVTGSFHPSWTLSFSLVCRKYLVRETANSDDQQLETMGLMQEQFCVLIWNWSFFVCVVSLCEHAPSDLEYAFREAGMMNVICAYFGAHAWREQITISKTPVIPYKAMLPALHAWKRSFMKMASESRKKTFPSSEIELLHSEMHKRIFFFFFSSICSELKGPTNAKELKEICAYNALLPVGPTVTDIKKKWFDMKIASCSGKMLWLRQECHWGWRSNS